MKPETTEVEKGLVGYVEVIERNGKINTIFEVELPEAELIWFLLPAVVRPPMDLSISVKADYRGAGEPKHFYVLTYDDVVLLCDDFTETFNAEFEETVDEMVAKLKGIQLFMDNVLSDGKLPRLIFWVSNESLDLSIEDRQVAIA